MLKYWINCLLFVVILVPLNVVAGEDDDLKLYSHLYQQIIEDTPFIEVAPVEFASASKAYIHIDGMAIELNSYTWNLVRAWLRVYKQELENQPMSCNLPDTALDTGVESAKPKTNFLQRRIYRPLIEGGKSILRETVSIGSVLGHTAFVAKVTSEIAETVLSKVVGGGGVHVFCSVIDAALIFGYRYFQAGARAPLNVWKDSSMSLADVLRLYFISRAVRKAQKKVVLLVEPQEIDLSQLPADEEENHRGWLKWPQPQSRNYFLDQLATVGELQLREKNITGAKYKRLFWLVSKKWGKSEYIWGKSDIEKASRSSWAWVLAVQEEMVEPVFETKKTEKSLQKDEIKFTSIKLSQEISKLKNLNNFSATVLMDLASIMESSKLEENYVRFSMLEALLTGVIRETLEKKLHQQLESSQYSMKDELKMRWKIGTYTRYIYEYFDYLRVFMLKKDGVDKRWMTYSLLKVMSQLLVELSVDWQSIIKADQDQALKKMDVSVKTIMSARPWLAVKKHSTLERLFAPRCDKNILTQRVFL